MRRLYALVCRDRRGAGGGALVPPRVGAASGTVAKTISAYDKEVSDDLYGSGHPLRRPAETPRGDARSRVGAAPRASSVRHARSNSRLFVFADTVSARNFAGTNECHGWVGLRFQTRPGGDPAGRRAAREPDGRREPAPAGKRSGARGQPRPRRVLTAARTFEDFLTALFDDLAAGASRGGLRRVPAAPSCREIDPRLALVELAASGRAEGVVFPADGRLIPPTELLHGCPVLLEPGQFAQVQSVFGGMLTAALGQLGRSSQPTRARRPPSHVLPIRPAGEAAPAVAAAEILRRVDELRATGHGVLVFRAPRALPHDRARESLHGGTDSFRDRRVDAGRDLPRSRQRDPRRRAPRSVGAALRAERSRLRLPDAGGRPGRAFGGPTRVRVGG